MSRPTRRRILLGIALIAFVGLGLPDGVLGTSWPFVRADLERPVEDLGLIITAMTIASALTAALSGQISRRIGTGGMLLAALAATMVGAGLWAIAPSWPSFVAGATMVGFGGGLLDPGVNHHVARHHGTRSMNSLHLAYGLGATVGPMVVVGALQLTGTWRWGFAAILLVYAPVAVPVAITRSEWGAPRLERHEHAEQSVSGVRVTRTLMWFATATGIEVAGGQWAFTILDERGMADTAAAGFVAAYWGGLTGGRLLGAVAGNRMERRQVLSGSLVLLAMGYSLFSLDPLGLGAFGLPIAGAGMALVFPTLVLATEEVHGEASDLVMGWSFSAAALGAAVLPWAVGVVGARSDLEVIPVLMLVATIGFAVLLAPLLRASTGSRPDLHSPDG